MVNSNKIAGLDSLRFFAFLSVFLYHNSKVFPLGYLGIDFFFVLSSFLITFLALQEIKITNGFSRINFFIRRSLRIYPLYFSVLFFSFIILPQLIKFSNAEISLPANKYFYYLFVSNYDLSDHLFALKFLWSIAVEEQFYLLFLLLSFFFTRNFSISIIALAMIYFVFVFLAWRFNWSTYFNSLNYLIDFAVGMCLAKWYTHFSGFNLKLIVGVIVLSALNVYFFYQIDALSNFVKLPLAILFSAIILLAVKLFSFRFFYENKFFITTEYLGKLTFGLYVYSGFVITFGYKFIPVDNLWFIVFIDFLMLIAISITSYYLFEKPFLKLKNRFRFNKHGEAL